MVWNKCIRTTATNERPCGFEDHDRRRLEQTWHQEDEDVGQRFDVITST